MNVYLALAPYTINEQSIVKIGCTRGSPSRRVRALSSAGVPGKFSLVCYFTIQNGFDLERYLIRNMARYRLFGNRELFEVSPQYAKNLFFSLCSEYLGFQPHTDFLTTDWDIDSLTDRWICST